MIDMINDIALFWWDWMAGMFWQVGLLIILVACIDAVIKRWAWPQLRYALWLLVLLKLMLPPSISMPGSLTQTVRPEVSRAIERAANKPATVSENPTFFVVSESAATAQAIASRPQSTFGQQVSEPVFESYASSFEDIAPADSAGLIWQSYAFVIWLLGMLVLGGWLLSRLYRLRRSRSLNNNSCSIPQSFYETMSRCAQQLKLRRIPRIVVTEKVICPAVFGVFKPVLLMPKRYLSKLTRKNAEHMLLHELAHIKRGDPVVHSLYLLLQIAYWFNPLLWLARRQLIHLRELCCDATVARILKNKTCEYRETIIDIARRYLTKPVEPGLGLLGLFEDTNRLLIRLTWLEKKTWRYQKMKKLTVIIIIALMSAFVLPMAVGQEKQEDAVADLKQTEKELLQDTETIEVDIKKLEAKEELMQETQALQSQLEKLELAKVNLQKKLKKIAKTQKEVSKNKIQAGQAKNKAEKEKDKTAKFSADAKRWEQWADQWKNSKEFEQWQKDIEKWSQQIQQIHQNIGADSWEVDPDSEEFKQWHQQMQQWHKQIKQWQNSDEFKQWQNNVQKWSQEQVKFYQDTEVKNEHEHPTMPQMPPMLSMPSMPPLPPMPEDSVVSVDVVDSVEPGPVVVVTPKSTHSVNATPEITIPDIKVVNPPSLPRTEQIKPGEIKVEKEEDKYIATKEMEFLAKVKAGIPFVVRNNVGNVILHPSSDDKCSVRAVIKAKADTAEKAQEIVEQVAIKNQSSEEKFYLEPVKTTGNDKWDNLNVDLYISVPSDVPLDVSTSVGSIKINGLEEQIKCVTNVGSIKAVNIIGEIQLKTKVGDIEFVAQKDLSAKIQAITKVGSIKSDFPLEINKKDIVASTAVGNIGSGEKNILLVTEVGKIYIRKRTQKSSDDSPEQPVSVEKKIQNSVLKSPMAQLSSTVKLSEFVRDVKSIEEKEEGDRHIIERTEMMKALLLPGSLLDVTNEDGSITVTGSDTKTCQVDSVFTIKAPTAEAAKELSKKINIKMIPTDKGLSVKVINPEKTPSNHSFKVDLQIIVPVNTNLTVSNEDGNIQVKNITGNTTIKNEDGNISCENVNADMKLALEDGDVNINNSSFNNCNIKLEDGKIQCEGVKGNFDFHLEDGSVSVSYAEDASEKYTFSVHSEESNVIIKGGVFAKCRVNMESGKIDCNNVSGNLDLKLEEGKVKVSYADNVPNDCTINVKLDEGKIQLSVPGEMLPTDGSSTVRKKDEGAEWKTKVSTPEGSRNINLKTNDGSVEVMKR
jgi:beta-lactamase regulating signal transducer with metallopeptidase domain